MLLVCPECDSEFPFEDLVDGDELECDDCGSLLIMDGGVLELSSEEEEDDDVVDTILIDEDLGDWDDDDDYDDWDGEDDD